MKFSSYLVRIIAQTRDPVIYSLTKILHGDRYPFAVAQKQTISDDLTGHRQNFASTINRVICPAAQLPPGDIPRFVDIDRMDRMDSVKNFPLCFPLCVLRYTRTRSRWKSNLPEREIKITFQCSHGAANYCNLPWQSRQIGKLVVRRKCIARTCYRAVE